MLGYQAFIYIRRAAPYGIVCPARSGGGTKRRGQSVRPHAARGAGSFGAGPAALARSARAKVTFFSPRTRLDALPLRSPFISRFRARAGPGGSVKVFVLFHFCFMHYGWPCLPIPVCSMTQRFQLRSITEQVRRAGSLAAPHRTALAGAGYLHPWLMPSQDQSLSVEITSELWRRRPARCALRA